MGGDHVHEGTGGQRPHLPVRADAQCGAGHHAFAGDALGDSSVQLAVAAVVVIGSIWTTLNMDGVFADFAALRKDMPDGVASSNFGAVLQKLPIGAMRVMGVVFTALMVMAELLAIY